MLFLKKSQLAFAFLSAVIGVAVFSAVPFARAQTAPMLYVDYGIGTDTSNEIPMTSSGGSATAQIPIPANTPDGTTYTYKIKSVASDGTVTYTDSDTFETNSKAPGTPATVSGITAVVGSDGTSVAITGQITTGGYDPASLVVDYGIGSDRSNNASVTITSSNSSGNDAFSVNIPGPLASGSYGFDISDDNVDTFAGSTGTFVIGGTGSTGTTSTGGTATAGTAGTTTTTGSSGSASGLSIKIPIQNPLKGTSTLPALLVVVLNALALLLAPIVVIMIVYAGFLFVAAQGNEEKLSAAKNALMYTLLGAAVTLGAKGFAILIAATITCLGGGSCS